MSCSSSTSSLSPKLSSFPPSLASSKLRLSPSSLSTSWLLSGFCSEMFIQMRNNVFGTILVHRIGEMVSFELGKEIEKDVFDLSMIAHDKTINIFLFSSTCEKKLVNSGVMFAKLC